MSGRCETSSELADHSLKPRSAVAISLLVGAVALLFLMPVMKQLQADGYMLLYDGRWITQHGLPHVEALTFAARGRAWVDQQWLAELAYYQAWKVGGYALVAILGAVAVACAFSLSAALILSRGASVIATVCISIVAIVAGYVWVFTRAQDLAFPLFALLVVLCVTDAQHAQPQRRLVLLVPLLALWANLHGSVILGAALATLYLAQRTWRTAHRGSGIAAAMCGALAVTTALTPAATPYGFHIVGYYSTIVGNRAIGLATIEWDAPRFGSPLFFELYGATILLLLFGARAVVRGRRISPVIVGGVLITAVMSAFASRNLVWFGMAAPVLFGEFMPRSLTGRRASRPGVLAVAAAAVAITAVAIASLATRSPNGYQRIISSRVLATASAYASSHPCAKILADNVDSSALLWLDPSLAGRIGFDARLQQYPPEALRRWVAYDSGTARGWLATTSGYQLLIANSTYSPVTFHRLETTFDRQILARSARAIAVVNDPPSGAPCPRAPRHA